MDLLKKGILLALVSTTFFVTSCSEDPCIAPALTQNIIGVWLPQLSGGQVEFKSDGTFVDPDDAIFGVEVNGVVYDQKTYVVTSNTITITAMPSAGVGTASQDFEVTQNDCDEIKISVIGITETLVRQ